MSVPDATNSMSRVFSRSVKLPNGPLNVVSSPSRKPNRQPDYGPPATRLKTSSSTAVRSGVFGHCVEWCDDFSILATTRYARP